MNLRSTWWSSAIFAGVLVPGLRTPISGHQKNAPALSHGGNGFVGSGFKRLKAVEAFSGP